MAMKKSKLYLFLLALSSSLSLSLTSCQDLDLEPKDVLGEEILFKNDYGIQKYMARIYNELPIEDFNFDLNGSNPGFGYAAGGYHNGNNYWEALKGYSGSLALESTGRSTGSDMRRSFDYWPYGRIRDINNFIAKLPAYEAELDAETYENALGEAHFLRAFYYFGMVKRYGGVPIVDEVQDPLADVETLQLPRSTEYDSWMFIHDDLQYAMEHASKDKKNTGRANRYSAAALMARAMLFAGSVAKYGHNTGITGVAVDQGLQGMDQDVAREFFQYAYDACKFIGDAGFTLHQGKDKEAGYVETFVTETEEDIFVKRYGSVESRDTYDKSALLHCWDALTLPVGTNLSTAVGCCIQPVWELISLYEMPKLVDEEGKPVRFNTMEELWNNGEMEPRCRANFYFSGMKESVSGQVINTQTGVYSSYPGTALDGCPENAKTENDYNNQFRTLVDDPGKTAIIDHLDDGTPVYNRGQYGYYNGLGDEGTSYTGTYVRKYVNPAAAASTRTLFGSGQTFKVFRYGQVLCDWAEAAYELGIETTNNALKEEAIKHVNEIRDRAGAHPYTYVSNPQDVGSELYGFEVDENLQYIRDERRREQCFENLTYWDNIRWRIADSMFDNAYLPHSLWPFYVASEKKFIFLTPGEYHLGRRMTFQKKWYYDQLPGGEIAKNPNIIRNEGY